MAALRKDLDPTLKKATANNQGPLLQERSGLGMHTFTTDTYFGKPMCFSVLSISGSMPFASQSRKTQVPGYLSRLYARVHFECTPHRADIDFIHDVILPTGFARPIHSARSASAIVLWKVLDEPVECIDQSVLVAGVEAGVASLSYCRIR